LLVAVKSYVAHDPFRGANPIVAGRSFAAETSDVVAANPENWAPAAGRRPGAREEIGVCSERATIVTREATNGRSTQTTAPGRRSPKISGLEPWLMPPHHPDVTVLPGFASTSALLRPDAERELYRILDATKSDGYESLAAGFGDRGRTMIEVIRAVDVGCNRSRTSVDLDGRRTCEAIEDMRARGLGLVSITHSHPSGRVRLSVADLDVCRELLRGPQMASLLATVAVPTDSGWHLESWLVSRGLGEKDRCQRCKLRTVPARCA
jgi:proteasome lid subunit RPN8/RPN11